MRKIERGEARPKCAQASSAATLAMYRSHLVMTMTRGMRNDKNDRDGANTANGT